MARIAEMTTYVHEPRRNAYHAPCFPLRDYRPAPRKATFLRLASQITDIALCLGTGAFLLGALFLLLVSF